VPSRAICLLGRDYPELGPLGIAALEEGGAIALSRGSQPKPYPHQDPNEDGALLLHTDGGVLLAVVDGYNGVEASEAALLAVIERAGDLCEATGSGFRAVVGRVVGRVAERLPAAAQRSRTCLVLARVSGRRCEFASFGDSSLLRTTRPEPVTTPNELVLGRALELAGVPLDLWYGSFECSPGERLVLATDGVTNFGPAAPELARAAAEAASDRLAARELAELALRGGAGDNVAVCVYRSAAS
jgi:serine/threonine protein phosphatase PrpC